MQRDTRLVLAFAVVLGTLAFALSHRAILTTDGHIYFEMARGFAARGTLEVDNGLGVHDSNDLLLAHVVKRGLHLYAKYPPLFAPLAALPVVALGVRGLYLLEAIGLVVVILVFHRLALRVLPRRRALWATLAMPFVAPVFPYAMMELPHLVSAALALGSVLLALRAIEETDRRRAVAFGVGSGLLVGYAIGVRLQEVFFAAALVPAVWLFARHRVAIAGQLAGLSVCTIVIALMNRARFGSLDPFSYGPVGVPGGPPAFATSRWVLASGFVVSFALILGAFALARWWRRLPLTAGLAAAVALVVAGTLGARATIEWMAESAFSFLVNANGLFRGWSIVETTYAWFDKPLLACSPLLVIGLIACVVYTVRTAPPTIRASAWICVLSIVFMSTRNPDPVSEESVVGYLSLSPRYLTEVMPLLFLLAAWTLRSVRITRAGLLAACIPGGIVAMLLVVSRDDFDPPRGAIILFGSVSLAAVVGALTLARRWAGAGPLLATSALFAAIYGASSTLAIDTVALGHLGANAEHWTDLVAAQTPQRFVLVGWHYYKDGVITLRERRDVVIVDASYDQGRDLTATLEAFHAAGWPIYWVSSELERVRPQIDAGFDPVVVDGAPLLWRLQPKRAR